MNPAYLLLALAVVVAPAAHAVNGEVHEQNPPAQGQFFGAEQVENDPYKAGEINIKAGGVLPPTEERVVIDSGGTKGRTYNGADCTDFRVREDDGDRIAPNQYCEFNSGPNGTYLWEAKYTLTAEADIGLEDDKEASKAVASHYIDDGPPGRNTYFNPRESCYFYPPDNYYECDRGGGDREGNENTIDANERVIGKNTVSGDTSKIEDSRGNRRHKTGPKTFEPNGTLRLGYTEQCTRHDTVQPGCPPSLGQYDEYDELHPQDGGSEKFYINFDYEKDYPAESSYSFKGGSMTYVTPNGNSYVDVNGSFFGGTSYRSNTEVSVTASPDRSGWQNTSKTINIGLPRNSNNPVGGTRRVKVRGEYWASSPPGVSPEGYRWVYSPNPSKVLVSHTNLDSSVSGFRTLGSSIDQKQRPERLPSGEYRLQVKSSADNYAVDLRQADFTVNRDSFIRYRGSRVFSPELELGDNPMSFYTRGSNNLRYDVDWTECQDPAKNIQPGNNTNLETTSPILSVTTNCNSVDSVEFRNAKTETTVKTYADVQDGTKLEAESDVLLGETYRWYVRFCDQGKCYDTETYEFTVGNAPTDNDPLTSETDVSSPTEGLDREIRDEDFNTFGQDTRTSTPLSQGYINKIEDDSNQLETGPKWNNSDGSGDNADQYAITPTPRWTVDNRGNIYPPPTNPQYRSTYYRDTSNRRTKISDPSVPKSSKVFGNSLGAVANQDITDSSGDLIARQGTGTWIDPDQITKTKDGREYDYAGNWKQLITFNIDITGPDSGLGYDNNKNNPTNYKNNRKVAITDIHWQRKP